MKEGKDTRGREGRKGGLVSEGRVRVKLGGVRKETRVGKGGGSECEGGSE